MTKAFYSSLAGKVMLLNIAVACLLLLHVREAFLPAGGMLDASGMFVARDFVNFWAGAHLFAEGNTALLFDWPAYQEYIFALFGQQSAGQYIWSYPPHFGMLLVPLHWLSYPLALGLFELGSLTFMLGAVKSALPEGQRPALPLLVVATSPAVLPVLYMGQNGFLAAGCIIGALAWRQKHPLLAALCLALLTYKPQLGLALGLGLLILGSWRVLAYGVAITALWIAGSLALYGTEVWVQYFTLTLPHHSAMFSTYPQDYAMLSPAGNFLQWGMPYAVAIGLHLLIAAFVAVILLARLHKPVSDAWQIVLVAAATLLLSPYAQGHDAAVLLAALPLLFCAQPQDLSQNRAFLYTAALLWLLPVMAVISLPNHLYIGSVVLLGGYVYLARLAR